MVMLSMDTLPDDKVEELSLDQVYELKITRAEKVTASTGSEMLQLDLEIVGTPENIKFDNCVITKADGSLNDFGCKKLKKILKATNTIIEGDFPISLAATMLKGKRFKGKITKDQTPKGRTVYKLGNLSTFDSIEEVINLDETNIELETPIDPSETIDSSDW